MLLKEYKACVVTGCPVISVLQAAHIRDYADGGKYCMSNGLVLRADIHSLMGAFQLKFVPLPERGVGWYAVKLAEAVRADEEYENLEDKAVFLPHADINDINVHASKFKA